MAITTSANTFKPTAVSEWVWRGCDFSQSSTWVNPIDSEAIADLNVLAQALPCDGLLDCELTSKTMPRLSQLFVSTLPYELPYELPYALASRGQWQRLLVHNISP